MKKANFGAFYDIIYELSLISFTNVMINNRYYMEIFSWQQNLLTRLVDTQ